MDKLDENIEKIIKAYFEEPNKDLKEIFKKFTEGFSKEEKEASYKNLKEIVS